MSAFSNNANLPTIDIDALLTTSANIDIISLNRITPVPSQIFTAYYNKSPLNLTLDTGATVSFIKSSIVDQLKIPVQPNNQLALLVDSETRLHSMGEIDIKLNRGKFSVRFRALVVQKLQCDMFAGQTFHLDNDVQPRILTRTIKFHNKFVVFQTNENASLPNFNDPSHCSNISNCAPVPLIQSMS